ncbi:MAG: crotonase [Gammaproteobacteria bacterium RIFCSPHIGHO2_12_FULL_41_20]|nr:MAG: crotonase [Gammaproteobacteria bacterium RIFCSPHIGHO2_12_FULL_41_20]
MSAIPTYQHWRLEADSDQVLWLYFDKKNATVNTFDRAVMEELSQIVTWLASAHEYKGVIVASAKKQGFIAGADISQFSQFKDIAQATELVKRGQHIFDQVAALKIPTVAMIEGFCLGGGLEFALACRYRVAEDGAKTRLGLPEIKVGIHPGWGGSIRLPKLIGAPQALNMILSGHTVSAKAAAKLGFVDAAVPKRHLIYAAKHYVLQPPAPHQAAWWQQLTNKQPARMLLAPWIRKKLRAKADPAHYPAPYALLDNWERYGVDGQVAMDREAASCGRLFFSDTAQNLVRIFFLQERLKGLAKEVQFNPRHVHVVGGGTMGGDIAAWCALRGFTVTLQDLQPRFIAPAMQRAHALFKEKLKEAYLVRQAMDRLVPDLHGDGIRRADVIIEAVVEDLKIKQSIFKSLESQAKPTAILATNTSSIPLDEINVVLQAPQRLVGIHFFNPVAKMPLVEVVQGQKTDQQVVEKAAVFVRKIDRLPLPVKSSPGFLVNRILMPYLMEAMALYEEGVPAPVIDKAMVEFGMPMGPITLADYVGLDVCLSVAKYFSNYFHTPVPEKLLAMVEQKKLGKKSGEGFYQYDKKGKKIKEKEATSTKPLEEISERLVLCMLNESFACLREGVVADADLLDAGMIFGTGFAPFRGGPIHYAKTQGIHELYQQFVKQQEQRGDKVTPPVAWEEVV